MDQLPRLGKSELICLLSSTCNYMVSVRRGFLVLLVPEMGCLILLWHSLSLSYNHFACINDAAIAIVNIAEVFLIGDAVAVVNVVAVFNVNAVAVINDSAVAVVKVLMQLQLSIMLQLSV